MILPERIRSMTAAKIAELEQKIQILQQEHFHTCEMAAKVILAALDYRDHYTFNHSIRVAYYSSLIGKELGLSSTELYQLELAAIFHDIGKIGIADAILLKPTRLSEEELKIMKNHPEISYNILREFDDFEEIALYTRYHHENFDGSGYMHGLKGSDIPLFSRIMLISDTFDAMTTSRPYRKKLTNVQAFNELVKYSKIQFDEVLVDNFLSAINKQHLNETRQYNLDNFKEELHKKAA